MRIHAITHGSRVNGPGLRSVLHVQGCTIGCAGCHNPLTWDPTVGRQVDPDALAEEIIRESAPGTVGLTISGGEPMQQPVSVYALMCSIEARRPDWDIGLFSGFRFSELMYGEYTTNDGIPTPRIGWERFLGCLFQHQICPKLTWGIFGRYERDRPPSGIGQDIPWRHAVSSANQMLTMFRRKWIFEDFPALQQEVSIEDDGLVKITGYSNA